MLADFNADGRIDIAVSNQKDNTVSILLTRPDGSYSGKIEYPVGAAPTGMITADLNGDHIPDLAVVNSQDNNVSVLLGAANGTFQTATTYATGKLPVAIVAADLNGDQKIDLAVANQGDGTVSLLLGNGNGHFSHRQRPRCLLRFLWPAVTSITMENPTWSRWTVREIYHYC